MPAWPIQRLPCCPRQPFVPLRWLPATWLLHVQAVIDGSNLNKHLANIQEVYGLPVVVAINNSSLDTVLELEAVYESCKKTHIDVVISDVWAKGGAGGRDLAEKVIQLAQEEKPLSYVYNEEDSIETKLNFRIVTKFMVKASANTSGQTRTERIRKLWFSNYPICMAKTQYSFRRLEAAHEKTN